MATKRTRIARLQHREMSEAVRQYLETGDWQPGAQGAFRCFMKSGAHGLGLLPDWQVARDELLAAWVKQHPGTRPWAWWQFEAPRWPRSDWPAWMQRCGGWCDDLWAEPRRRVGGTGTPAYESAGSLPRFDRGVPVDWVSQAEVREYRAIARAAPGRAVKALDRYARAFRGKAIDPRKPPTFESQATYLLRHTLLPDAERRRLPVNAFDPELITLEPDPP